MVRQALEKDPEKRPSATHFLSSPAVINHIGSTLHGLRGSAQALTTPWEATLAPCMSMSGGESAREEDQDLTEASSQGWTMTPADIALDALRPEVAEEGEGALALSCDSIDGLPKRARPPAGAATAGVGDLTWAPMLAGDPYREELSSHTRAHAWHAQESRISCKIPLLGGTASGASRASC